MPSLLLVTRNFPPARGGIETMAWELAGFAARAGWQVIVVHFGQQRCSHPPAGIRAYRHFPGTGRFAALAVSAWVLPWLALRYRPRLLVHMQVTTALGGWLASRLGIPYLVVGLGLELLPGGPGWFLALRGWLLRRARRVVSISRFTDGLAEKLGVPAARRAVINPGTRGWSDPAAGRSRAALFGAGAEGVFLCLSLSRLVPRKGVDKVIEALALVLRERDDILYCVGGAGPDLERLQALAGEKGVGKHVRFLGRVSEEDMGACYALADLFVLPARTSDHPPDAEGFGIVYLEAAACGTPSLAGASGGVPDAVEDGRTGFLVDPLDAGALAERMLALMSDRELLRRLGEGARARAAESGWENACARYYRAFAEAAGLR